MRRFRHLTATLLSSLVLVVCVASPSTAEARKGGPFGLGVELGDPSGLSFKYFLGGETAVDGHLGFSLRHDWFRAHVDYLFHFPQRWGGGHWLPYVGIGGKLAVWDHHRGNDWYDDDDEFALGARVPLGIAWHPRNAPIDVFGEVVPGLWILPGTDLDFDFSIGVRFYF